ncbi:MAG: sialate O-acetylesterase [Rubritalea sp.]|uniref:sialate O-acetylesterase n=1 Tax=Rubritalea sp. TaxID=2109375 RepID=UPI0032422D2B
MNLSKSTFITCVVASSGVAMADVKPARLFMDHMVIQRETQAPVWGSGDAGEKVTVTGSWGESATTTADKNGQWSVKLQTPKAGGPHTITFQGENNVQLKNVLSGDVWLCSGQSNMVWPVSKLGDSAEVIKNANYPQIRSFMVDSKLSLEELDDCGGAWAVCSPQTVQDFSATAYFTGRELHKNLDVPIGLLTSCYGGTCIEGWTPLAEQADDPYVQKKMPETDPAAKGKNRNYPGNLYNGMIHPLQPFSVKGVVWYQGENNANSGMNSASHYRVQLARLARGWRKAWGLDFPFYAVQLPNFKNPQVDPVEGYNAWAMIRESFVHAANNTADLFTCTMIDLGGAGIHPQNKLDVGLRMASTILNKTYGKGTPTTPFMKSFKMEGGKVVISFDYTGSGLVAKGGKLKTFAIAGADRQFVWADAEIVNRDGVECVAVSSAEVKEPASVRYAWASNPAECNLFSKEGFPASPFRTDDWKPVKPEESPEKKTSSKKKKRRKKR